MGSKYESDYLDAAFPLLLDVHGEEVTIVPKGQPPSVIQAVVEWVSAQSDSFEEGRERHTMGTLLVASNAIEGWVPNENGDAFAIDGNGYALTRVVKLSPIFMLEFLKIDQRRWGGADVYAKR